MNHIYLQTLRAGAALTVALAAAACSDEPMTAARPGEELSFDVAVTQGWQTPQGRAASEACTDARVLTLRGDNPADTLFLHMDSKPTVSAQGMSRGTVTETSTIESFGVYGFTYSGGDWDTAADRKLYVSEEAEKSKNWTLYAKWPGRDCSIRFFALTPEIHNFEFDPQTLTVACHINSDAEQQRDLLVAATEGLPGNRNSSVSLAFSHALTAVKFVAGDDMAAGSLKKITVSGVYGKGVYSFTDAEWGTPESLAAYTYEPETGVGVDGTPDTPVTPDEATFMLLPQTLPAGAAVEVVYEVAGQEFTLSADISGTEWKQGHTVTYRISTSSIMTVLEVVTPKTGWPYSGGKQTYSLTSYISSTPDGGGDAVKSEVPVEFEFLAYNEATQQYDKPVGQPDWITGFTHTAGTAGSSTLDVTLARQEPEPTKLIDHDAILRAAAPVSGIYDLSTKGGTTAMNTANCYIVNAPGKYRFPLVYGNAIKNGQDNKAAYTATKTGDEFILENFINHLGKPITSPYIYENEGISIRSGHLYMEDAQGLVTDAVLSDDNKYITFEVPQANIRQGNAIVAVYDGSNTVWTWHIWVTDYVPELAPTDTGNDLRDKVVKGIAGESYTLMPNTLGWCYDLDGPIEGRTVMMRVKQSTTGKHKDVLIEQLPVWATHGTQSYYQYGRKDPLPSLTSTDPMAEPTVKEYFTPDGIVHADIYNFDVDWTIDKLIANRIAHSLNYFSSGIRLYYNLWNNNYKGDNTDSSSDAVKTIYDPSPVGYQVPGVDVYNAFMNVDPILIDSSEGLAAVPSPIAAMYEMSPHFYTDGDSKSGATIFLNTAGGYGRQAGTILGGYEIGVFNLNYQNSVSEFTFNQAKFSGKHDFNKGEFGCYRYLFNVLDQMGTYKFYTAGNSLNLCEYACGVRPMRSRD